MSLSLPDKKAMTSKGKVGGWGDFWCQLESEISVWAHIYYICMREHHNNQKSGTFKNIDKLLLKSAKAMKNKKTLRNFHISEEPKHTW